MEIENHKEQVPFAHYRAKWRELDPAETASRTGAPFDGSAFHLTMLGVDYTLAWPEFSIEGDGFARGNIPAQILLMRYLMGAAPARATGKFLTFRETPWGDVYIKPFTGRCLNRAAFTFGPRLAEFSAAMERLGPCAKKIAHGDAAYEVEFLPGLSLQCIVWAGDDEFPPSAQLLFSDNFPAVFAAEDLVVCCDVLIGAVKSHM